MKTLAEMMGEWEKIKDHSLYKKHELAPDYSLVMQAMKEAVEVIGDGVSVASWIVDDRIKFSSECKDWLRKYGFEEKE